MVQLTIDNEVWKAYALSWALMGVKTKKELVRNLEERLMEESSLVFEDAERQLTSDAPETYIQWRIGLSNKRKENEVSFDQQQANEGNAWWSNRKLGKKSAKNKQSVGNRQGIVIGFSVQVPRTCPKCRRELLSRGEFGALVRENDGTITDILECGEGHMYEVRYTPSSIKDLVYESDLRI
jgi:hypothetical protein